MASASSGTNVGTSTPRPPTGNETPDENFDGGELLAWIMEHIIQDPVGGDGALAALQTLGVQEFTDLSYMSYAEIDALPHKPAKAATTSTPPEQEIGARVMVRQKIKLFYGLLQILITIPS